MSWEQRNRDDLTNINRLTDDRRGHFPYHEYPHPDTHSHPPVCDVGPVPVSGPTPSVFTTHEEWHAWIDVLFLRLVELDAIPGRPELAYLRLAARVDQLYHEGRLDSPAMVMSRDGASPSLSAERLGG